jgi:L-ascorbate metabolism protein UlaG (beta-lactamase superfamily)
MGPDEAMRVFKEIGAKWFIPMHFGTFKLSFEALDEPPRWLLQLAKKEGITHQLKILDEGIPEVF